MYLREVKRIENVTAGAIKTKTRNVNPDLQMRKSVENISRM